MTDFEIEQSIYLAGPWFTPEAMATQVRIEELCAKLGRPVFSPRKECLLNPKSPIVDQRRAFQLNVVGLKLCKLILANVEGLDTGTIWEMGAAYAFHRPVAIYSSNPDRKLNVMLAQGASGFLAGWSKVEAFLQPDQERDFCWGEVEPWTREIF